MGGGKVGWGKVKHVECQVKGFPLPILLKGRR